MILRCKRCMPTPVSCLLMYAASACLSFHATLTASQRHLHTLIQSYKHMSPKHMSPKHMVSLHTACFMMHFCACVCGRHHGDPAVWAPLCDAWDRALQMLSRARGVTPLSFRTLMEGHVAHQLLKPVRARWQLFMQCDSDMYMCTFMQVQVDNNNLTYLCIYIPTQHVHKCLLSMFHNKMQLAAHSRYFFWRHVCY